jgi:methionyl-tRNA synthetase
VSEPRRYYITTAIDYANGSPHMGHAFEKIGADAMARYHRLRGDDVHFVMGMDEHGL